ncbi:MAG: hypothetical protein WCK82_15715 [Bacteroidota bacterium]
MSIDASFDAFREKAELLYKKIGEVYCPYFKEKVAFNEKGINHIKFKSLGFARERKDQLMRLKNIHLAPRVLAETHTLQERESKKEFIDVHTNTRNEKILKDITYYAFIAILFDENIEKRVKVVVRQVSGGNKVFWSIIPCWGANDGGKKFR